MLEVLQVVYICYYHSLLTFEIVSFKKISSMNFLERLPSWVFLSYPVCITITCVVSLPQVVGRAFGAEYAYLYPSN